MNSLDQYRQVNARLAALAEQANRKLYVAEFIDWLFANGIGFQDAANDVVDVTDVWQQWKAALPSADQPPTGEQP